MPHTLTPIPEIRNSFDAAIARNRIRRASLILSQRKGIDRLLRQLSSDLASMISSADEFSFRWWRRNETQAQLRQIMTAYVSGYRGNLFGAIETATGETVSLWEGATSEAMAARGFRLNRSFSQIPIAAMQEIFLRVGTDGLTLSNRVWNLGQQSLRQINRIIVNAISTGESAASTARTIRNFAKSPLSLADRKDLRKLRGTMRRLGSSLRFRSERLARTEIANAYHEANRRSATRSPIISGLKWNLSAAHPEQDICDSLASANDYGLGAGVYPPSALPFLPHPHDLCFITSVLRPVSEWDKPKPRIRRLKRTKGIITRRAISKKGRGSG